MDDAPDSQRDRSAQFRQDTQPSIEDVRHLAVQALEGGRREAVIAAALLDVCRQLEGARGALRLIQLAARRVPRVGAEVCHLIQVIERACERMGW